MSTCRTAVICFVRNGWLHLEPPALAKLSERLNRMQPLLCRLSAAPMLVTFFSLLERAMAPDISAGFALSPVFRELTTVSRASRDRVFYRLSWQSLTGGAARSGTSTQRFTIVAPKLDYRDLLPAGKLMARVDAIAANLDLDAAHGIQVRQTGEVALSDEELVSVSRGAVWDTALALTAVGLTLYLGLRSGCLMAAALASLSAGLPGTAAFAACASRAWR